MGKSVKKFQDQMESDDKVNLTYESDPALFEYQSSITWAMMDFYDITMAGFLKFEPELKSRLSTEPHYSHCYGIHRVYRETGIVTSLYRQHMEQGKELPPSHVNMSLFTVHLFTRWNVQIALAFNGAMPANRKLLEKRVGTELADILDQIARNDIQTFKRINEGQFIEFLSEKAIPADMKYIANEAGKRFDQEMKEKRAKRREQGLPEDSD